MNDFFQRSPATRVVGMVHVKALPGAPAYSGDFAAVVAAAIADAKAIAAGGAHAVMIENFFDTPFPRGESAVVTVSHLTAVAIAVANEVSLPLGINVLRNDSLAALAIAQACGAVFIRVNVLSGTRAADQGLIQGDAYALLRERQRCGAAHIGIAADVDVKHSAAIAKRPIAEEAIELSERAGADALIVSGNATGDATNLSDLETVRKACPTAFLMVGSGVAISNIKQLSPHCDAVIVGTSIKATSQIDSPVDVGKVAELVRLVGTR
jgi:hypothetical protein